MQTLQNKANVIRGLIYATFREIIDQLKNKPDMPTMILQTILCFFPKNKKGCRSSKAAQACGT
jgi:hypothetical protein